MKKIIRTAGMLFLAMSGIAGATQAANGEAASRVVEQFHAALKSGDSSAASGFLASTAQIFESGYSESRADYVAHHLAADIAFAKDTQRSVKTTQQQCNESLCVLMQTSENLGTFKGKKVHDVGAETTVLVREGGIWKIQHVHWSSHKYRD